LYNARIFLHNRSFYGAYSTLSLLPIHLSLPLFSLYLSGVHPATYWICNFIADSIIVQFSLLSVYAAVMLGGEPIRDYFLSSSMVDAQGGIFLESIFVFSFAVVASSYTFTALSSDQLSSQLLMLVSTVAGGVFLKLYLDRHSGPFFGFLTSIFLWFSPCFTFSTCMFDLFALRGAQMSIKFGASVGSPFATSVAAVNKCIHIMLFQIVFYLTATIVIDCNCARILGALTHFRFLLSLPLWSQAIAEKKAHDEDHVVEVAAFRGLESRSSIPTPFLRSAQQSIPSLSVGANTPLNMSSHCSYNALDRDEDTYATQNGDRDRAGARDYPFTDSKPGALSLFPGLLSGKGTRRILKEHGTVYGDIGGLPGVREMEAGVNELRRRSGRKRSGEDRGGSRGSLSRSRSLDSYDIESAGGRGAVTRARGGCTDTDSISNDAQHAEEEYDHLVKADDLFVEYAYGSKRKMALNGLAFEIKKGERVALLGTATAIIPLA
jgi:hypothetical protein